MTLAAWAALAVGAFFVGLGKTSIGGVTLITVALASAVLPARESTGLVLLLFLVGDIFALRAFRAHADWKVLRTLAPSVVVGVAIGAAYLHWFTSDTTLRRTIGIILLSLALLHIVMRRIEREVREHALPRPITDAAGSLAGFTSMVANAGGGVMSIYLLNMKSQVLGVLGTNAWFFFAVNAFKLPFSIGLGLISISSLGQVLVLAPFVVLGAMVGNRLIRRVNMVWFQRLVVGITVVAALRLLA